MLAGLAARTVVVATGGVVTVMVTEAVEAPTLVSPP
jgi:hypothetical protein